MKDDRRYCPLHGDYLPQGRSAQCPICRSDPAASSVSLRQVRVIDEDQLDPEGVEDHQPTELGERFECPVCGSKVPGVDFRVEAAGEVWVGDAAVWAEEGVCSDCYREVISKNIREWSQAEWLGHHYEGWHRMTLTVYDIVAHEYSPQEAWLPEEERHPILDLEATLVARRAHLARCQMAMEELQGRYDTTITPPPFQMTLASASEALSGTALEELRARREEDLRVEVELRQASAFGIAPLPDEEPFQDDIPTQPRLHTQVVEDPSLASPDSSPRPRVLLAVLIAAAVIAAGLIILVSLRS